MADGDDDGATSTAVSFLLALAHDLRSPIGAVLHQIQLLSTRDLPPELRARSVAALEHNGAELESILETLADIERLLLGEVVSQPRTVLLEEVVTATDIAGHEADVDLVIPPGERATVDPAIVRRIVGMLCLAVRRGGGRPRIELRRDDVEVVVVVGAADEDDGSEAAVSSPTPTDSRPDVHLVLCHALAELHGGRLEVAADGRGGEVHLTATPD